MVKRIVLGAGLVALLLLAACGDDDADTPDLPTEESTIAVLGCSNTRQHAGGYTEVSEKDLLAFGPFLAIDGKTLHRIWAFDAVAP